MDNGLLLAAGLGVVGLVLTTWGGWVLCHEVVMWRWRRSLSAFEMRFPRTVTVADVGRWVGTVRSIARARRWWSVVPRWPLCVEITATSSGIQRVVLIPARLRADVLATLNATLPGVRLDELTELTDYATPRRRLHIAAEARMRSRGEVLAVDRGDDASRHLLAALQPLESGEWVRVQWLITGARAPRSVVSATEPGEVPAYWAQPHPVLRATCRVAVASRLGKRRARAVFGRVWAALRHTNTPRARLVRRRWLPRLMVAGRVLTRAVPYASWPMILTAVELAGLLGFATGTALPGLPEPVARALPPPRSMPGPGHGVVIAASNYPTAQTSLRLTASDRSRHVWIVGPTGVGKSTLMANMIGHDIAAGHAVIVVDARGDLVADVADRIPAGRADDVVVIDPTTSGHLVGVNPLRAGPPEQAAALVFHVLHSIYASSWGPRTADILRATLLTLATARAPGGARFTMLEVPELLTNPGFRRSVTSQPLSPQLGSFWRWYESLSEPARLNAIGPVLNKVRAFALSTPMRRLLGQSDGVAFGDMIANRNIVLVPLKKGLLGAESASLIGSLVTGCAWQATLARAAIPAAARAPVWFYIDEFQDVVRLPVDIADMFAQARGLGLGLTLAHQYLGQLTPPVKAAVIGTARTQIVFQLGHHDAKDLAPYFAPLGADDLAHLGAFEVAMRPCVNGSTLAPVTGTTHPMTEAHTDGKALADASAARYGTAPADIEAALQARVTVPGVGGRRSNRIPPGGQAGNAGGSGDAGGLL